MNSTQGNAPRQVAADRGSAWIAEGWEQFKRDPGTWIGIVVVGFIAMLVIGEIPRVGSLAANLLTPVALGGLMLACQAQAQGQSLKIEHLWAGFSHPQFSQLVLLGVAYLVFGLLLSLLGLSVFIAAIGGALLGGGGLGGLATSFGLSALLGLLAALVLGFGFAMATWLAPQLVVLNGRSAIDAMKLSFAASLSNVPALLVYGLLSIVIIIVASIPFGLGLLVAGPVLLIASFACWRDLYG